MNHPPIEYFDYASKTMQQEKVLGGNLVHWLYHTKPGYLLERSLLSHSPFSFIYGWYNDSGWSRSRIPTFIKEFSINMSEFQLVDYKNFNEFFIRQFNSGRRLFPKDEAAWGAGAEGRYLLYRNIDMRAGSASDSGGSAKESVQSITIKGQVLAASKLLPGAEQWHGGDLLVARLCPVDYHRFHYSDAGTVMSHGVIDGAYHSVNPMALERNGQIFIENRRHYTVLQTKSFGRVAMIEVGAMGVGRIVQSASMNPGTEVARSQEKGYFTFGGSTVVFVFEKGKMKFVDELEKYSAKGIEVFFKLGEELGQAKR